MSIYFLKTYQRSFGTYPLKGAELAQAVQTAVEIGYRAIDTAQMYRNEADLGAALADLPVPRSDLLITTKVHPDNYGEDRFLASVEESLKALRIDQIDVLILHWPPIGGDVVPSLRLLDKAYRLGLAKHIGISNYTAAMMRIARATVDAPLVTNQVEFHPLLDQSVLLRTATEVGIPLSSYCSVARGAVFNYPIFTEFAAAYDKTPSQIALRWNLQKGVPITAMSRKRENIAANFNVMDFTLSSIDMDRITAMNATGHRIVGKRAVPWAPDFD